MTRLLIASALLWAFLMLVGFTPWALAAGLALILAALAIRSWYRNLEPLDVPTPPAAFPDPPQEEWVTIPESGAARLERSARPPATHPG